VGELAPEAWHANIAYVAQEPYLVPGSVADNVRLGAPAASDAAVRAALDAVGLVELPPDAMVGERGVGLSAGQRRRVGIARGLVRDAPLLLLDEPTAGLDAEAEATVLASVLAAARSEQRAVLLVAHRSAALALADRVVEISSRAEVAG